MKSISNNSPEADPATQQASDWLVRHDRGLTAAEQDEFFEWLAANPRNGEHFARQQRMWKEFNQLAQWRPEHSAEPNPDLLALPARVVAAKKARAMRWFGWATLAAAAGVALGIFWSKPDVPPSAVASVEIAANGYERRMLEDGSVVELNRGAIIRVTYLPAERHVQLVHGEASFKVAKDHKRPFIVRAGGVDVRAVGTAFNVIFDAKSVEVVVTEGKVQVNDAARGESLLATGALGETPLLSAGEKAVVTAIPLAQVAAMKVSPAELDQLLSWKPIVFEFNSSPLSEVVARFNSRNHVQLVLADPSLASLPIVASFRSDNIDGFVRLLKMTSGVRDERTGDTITLHASP